MSFTSTLVWHRATEELPTEICEVVTVDKHGVLGTEPILFDPASQKFCFSIFASKKDPTMIVNNIVWWINADEFYAALPAPEVRCV